MNVGRGDGGRGTYSPDYALVLEGSCGKTVIANNTSSRPRIKELVHDLGGHGEGFIQNGNVGTVWKGND